jgi:hypothetical protein
MTEGHYLVPDRGCGTCTACCTYLEIPGEGLDKPAGVHCRNLVVGRGCTIYDRRPGTCRSYNCLWRSLDNLPEEWRPDKSGLLMQLRDKTSHDEPFGVDCILIGDPQTVVSDGFAALVGGFIESGTDFYFTHMSAPGLPARQLLLNPHLQEAIAARDLPHVKALLLGCHQALELTVDR